MCIFVALRANRNFKRAAREDIDPRAALSLLSTPMRKIVSAAEMREIDRFTTERYATPSLLLMEQAAAAAAHAIATHFDGDLSQKKILILCGRGNNGGDGAALARALANAGARAHVCLDGRVEDTKGDARVNFEIVRSLGGLADSSQPPLYPLTFVEIDDPAQWEDFKRVRSHDVDVIVDALFGTGLTRPLEGLPLAVVEYLNDLRAQSGKQDADSTLIVSLDVPSGLDADSAKISGAAVRADVTVTFTAPKVANVLPPALAHNGQLLIADIGSPAQLINEATSKFFLTEAADARRFLVQTRYTPDSYKNTHGHALIIAGSREYTGAAVLCGDAAMRAGTGLVTLATSASAHRIVSAQAMPEIITAALAETAGGAVSSEAFERINELTMRASVVAIGPGLSSKDEATRHLVRRVVEERQTPIVIDADALNALAPWPANMRGSKKFPLILTPHLGEMRRLIGVDNEDALKDRVAIAREFAAAHGVILVLKGSRTLIAAPDGSVYVNPTGNAGLGTAGAGDTLTGIITGFNAQAFATLKENASALEATIAAVYVGGLAGDIAARERGMRTLVASDLREHFGAAIRSLDVVGEMP
ncbi:MAG: NAD(P)H-hydrate dehydratase [Pyrinomonadaceae bacterium]